MGHVEAGLRSRDKEMPEEINRICTDAVTDIFFASERSGLNNLVAEGYCEKQIHLVGNVMIDNLLFQVQNLKPKELKTNQIKEKLNNYCVVTLHRPSNVDNSSMLRRIILALNEISKKVPLIFPIHPRTRRALKELDISCAEKFPFFEPLSYHEFLNLWKDANCVITDGGGLQEETTALGVPCFTLRENTERPVTLSQGTNVLIGTDMDRLIAAVFGLIGEKAKSKISCTPRVLGRKSLRENNPRNWQIF